MNAPLAHVEAATERSEQVSSTAAAANTTNIKVVFRPPALIDTRVDTQPFIRVSPRLRSGETFSRVFVS